MNFIKNLSDYSLGADFGCGNGKYLVAIAKEASNSDFPKLMPMVASDVSFNLAKIVRDKGFDTTVVDILDSPFRLGIFDFFLSIAVVHHFCTEERRREAVARMIDSLRPGGVGLIQVWAKDQYKDSQPAKYIKKHKEEANSETISLEPLNGMHLPIHKGGTSFKYSDVLVPFKSKSRTESDVNSARYYHLFEEGELEALIKCIPHVNILESFYEQGNWFAIVQRLQ
ncbi:Alkylated DNA repair protein alkB 8 [Cichlidogyrus casuarinus]|uniref:Alkylated DNA repair protein alkB 8 n=1 Tax=Cichlidogyrus casuarinus TaxID=1844966 RepID=A0ABD2QKB4_9PLAT